MGTIVPILGIMVKAMMQTTSIGDALFTRTQQKVLGLLFGKPDERFYTNEIMRRVDMGRGTVSRELARLVDAGLLSMTREGNQNHYHANTDCPVFAELVSIVRKSFGVADGIREALAELDDKIEIAFIYGSISKGTETKSSDIDLMIIGNGLSYGSIMEAVMPLEASLRRSINPTLYDVNEFIAKVNDGNSFITRVIDQPKIMIKGSEDGIREIG